MSGELLGGQEAATYSEDMICWTSEAPEEQAWARGGAGRGGSGLGWIQGQSISAVSFEVLLLLEFPQSLSKFNNNFLAVFRQVSQGP